MDTTGNIQPLHIMTCLLHARAWSLTQMHPEAATQHGCISSHAATLVMPIIHAVQRTHSLGTEEMCLALESRHVTAGHRSFPAPVQMHCITCGQQLTSTYADERKYSGKFVHLTSPQRS